MSKTKEIKEYEEGIKTIDRAIMHKLRRAMQTMMNNLSKPWDARTETSIHIKINQINLLFEERDKLIKKLEEVIE